MDKLIQLMKISFGTVFTYYVKSHSCHFNVEGINFPELHKLFEEIYQDAWASIDDIGEQIRQLDAYAPSSFQRFMELSRVKDTNEVMAAHDMLMMLLKDTEITMAALTETFHAASAEDRQGLANFLAERLEAHSKYRWQLRATAKRIT